MSEHSKGSTRRTSTRTIHQSRRQSSNMTKSTPNTTFRRLRFRHRHHLLQYLPRRHHRLPPAGLPSFLKFRLALNCGDQLLPRPPPLPRQRTLETLS